MVAALASQISLARAHSGPASAVLSSFQKPPGTENDGHRVVVQIEWRSHTRTRVLPQRTGFGGFAWSQRKNLETNAASGGLPNWHLCLEFESLALCSGHTQHIDSACIQNAHRNVRPPVMPTPTRRTADARTAGLPCAACRSHRVQCQLDQGCGCSVGCCCLRAVLYFPAM